MNTALQELIESRREFPVSALIKLWIKTHKKPTAQRLGHEYHVLEYLAQWLAPLDTAGILETPLPWYVDRGVLKATAGKIGIKPEQLYTVLLCMEY